VPARELEQQRDYFAQHGRGLLQDLIEREVTEATRLLHADERLMGIATLLWTTRLRQRFRATVVGMYVLPEYRRQRIATELLRECVARARVLPEVEEVCLCITVGNDAARGAYIKYGFEPDYSEPRYFKHAGEYYDIEWLRLPLS
jgi:ribosomal protein S18 acetylase RimI-like enzyme